jgi:uncharacterized protein YecT (DUF1311 family)
MAKLALIAALATIFLGSSVAAAALKPPVIHERFTLLPCPANPKTTLELEGCAEHRIVKSDTAINTRVRVIFFLLKRVRSVDAQVRFVRGERAWLTYRQALCESRADVFEGGTLAGLVAANCVADANDAHLKDLRAFDHDLRPH